MLVVRSERMESSHISLAIATIVTIIVLTIAIVLGIRAFISMHTLGTFKFDNSGATYRCLFEFDDLDDVEKHKFAIVKIKEADLSLPGESKSQNRQPL